MASTEDAVALLEEIHHLMQLKGENPFKIRAFEKAIGVIAERDDLTERAKEGTLIELEGIGKGISEVLTEFLLKGTSQARDELRKAVPNELVELSKIPGLGAKKAQALIEQLEIKSVGELEYACKENRLLTLKGFGAKTQAKILENIAFYKTGEGFRRLGDAYEPSLEIKKDLEKIMKGIDARLRVSETGALRRRMEVLKSLDFLLETNSKTEKEIKTKIEAWVKKIKPKYLSLPAIQISYSDTKDFGYELAKTTATEEHWNALGCPMASSVSNEEEFYSKLKIPFIPPEARETGEEVKLAQKGDLANMIPYDGVKGIFHNHTTLSDGVNSLEEMVIAAKKEGFKYIGISDHSQSAFYARGLKPDTLLEQEKDIRKVQDKHPEIKIFWGIESDILADGSLDYDDKTLKKFDFVIASIHSRFQMDKETMTKRVLTAIRNPRTHFLGHMTGRLLLGRKGFELDMEKVIEEATKNKVAIEINSHPQRLDIDWRWGPWLRKNGTMVSINPDAHEVDGLKDVRYGIMVARKAMLPVKQILNSQSVKEVEAWLHQK
jgi:DNA polymerase (family X)